LKTSDIKGLCIKEQYQSLCEVVGLGLHKGEPVHLRLEPMDSNSGIIL